MKGIRKVALYDIVLKLLDKFLYSYRHQLDVVTIEQLVFESYEELIEKGTIGIENVKGYLYKMINHKILRYLKEVKKVKRFLYDQLILTSVMEIFVEEEKAENDRKQQVLFNLLEKMPERKQQLIQLRVIEEQAFADIAVTLNIKNVNTASKTFYRALAELRQGYLMYHENCSM